MESFIKLRHGSSHFACGLVQEPVSGADQKKKQEQKEEGGEAGLVDVASVEASTSPGRKAAACITVTNVRRVEILLNVNVVVDFACATELRSRW